MRNIYLQIPSDISAISELALATVTGSEGSTPQKQGSSALISRSGLVAGTVGGGVLEKKVLEMAKHALETRAPIHEMFHLDVDVPGGEDALCGGKIRVLIDPDLAGHLEVFNDIRECSEKRIPGILITRVTKSDSGNIVIQRIWETDKKKDLSSLTGYSRSLTDDFFYGSSPYDFREITSPPSAEKTGIHVFIEPVIPLPMLIIAGAGHIGKSLSRMGKMLDFKVIVIDDRPEYANHESLPFADRIIVGPVGQSLKELEIGYNTFIVIVTRDHKDDGEALKACITSNAAYIGMIGSKTKINRMRQEFIQNNLASIEQWNRIYAPIGIDINSKTVEEIAVSIAAQLIQIRNSN